MTARRRPSALSDKDWPGVRRAAADLGDDIRKVTGTAARVVTSDEAAQASIIVGTIGKSPLIDGLVKAGKLDVDSIRGRWESFVIETVDGNLVVAGSDKRGTIYGIYDISEKIGRVAMVLVGRRCAAQERVALRQERPLRTAFAQGKVPRHLHKRRVALVRGMGLVALRRA